MPNIILMCCGLHQVMVSSRMPPALQLITYLARKMSITVLLRLQLLPTVDFAHLHPIQLWLALARRLSCMQEWMLLFVMLNHLLLRRHLLPMQNLHCGKPQVMAILLMPQAWLQNTSRDKMISQTVKQNFAFLQMLLYLVQILHNV